MRLQLTIAMVIALVGFSSGCGSSNNPFSYRSSASGNQSSDGFTSVSLNLIDAGGLALVGADASSFSGSIQGCISGWSRYEITQDSTIRVPLDDRNCYFSLQEIEVGGVNYVTSSAASWSEGSAVSAISEGGERIRLSVASQLDSHILGVQSVVISYALVSAGDDKSIESAVGASISVIGATPIQLDIIEVALGIDPDDGAGLFNFYLGCSEEVAEGACGPHNLSEIKAGLALDSFGGELELEQCESLANAGQNGAAVDAGDAILAFGGLATGNLKGPAKLYEEGHDKLILALQASDGACKYFKVNVIKP